MKINFEKINSQNPLLIGEIACGHNGSLSILKKLINVAKKAGLKVIKFQIFTLAERSVSKSKEEKIFKKLTLSESEWKKAIRHAHANGLFVFADVYGFDSYEIAKKSKVDGYKIHSEDALNFALIEKVIKTDKIIILGIGGSYRSELFSLIDYLVKKKLNNKIILMTGFQVFPTPFKSHSVREIQDLIEKYSKFNMKIGFSDHVAGGTDESFYLPIFALGAGAVVIEKHFTIDRKLKLIDYYSSLNYDELKEFNTKFENYSKLLRPISDLSNDEIKYRNMFKKYPSIKSYKKKGAMISKEDVIFKKNKGKSQSLDITKIAGKKLLTNMKAGSPLTLNNISQKIGAVIVARMTSKRLPGKAVKKIGGKKAIVLLINRIKKIKNCDEIILATSTHKSDDQFEEIARKEKIQFFRGSLDNVALRYYEAAKKFSLDQILRITGDAIFCDEKMLEKSIDAQIQKGTDVTFIKNMPYGTNKEVFNFKTIEIIAKNARVKENTEYLEWFLENKRNFKVNYIKSNYKFNKNIRLTLDFEDDLVQLNNIYYNLRHLKHITLRDAIKYLNKNPKVIKINSHLIAKYERTELNINLNI